jgi:hypothetical protein
MILESVKIEDIVLLPIHVKGQMTSAGYIEVEFSEGFDGKTRLSLHASTRVYDAESVVKEMRPIEVDDIVFVAFVSGVWRVADRYKDTLFLTPHNWDGEARAVKVDACYHANLKPHEGK